MRILPLLALAVFALALAVSCGSDSEPGGNEPGNDRPRRTATAEPAAEPSPTPTEPAAVTPSRPPQFEPFPVRNADGSAQRDTCGTYTVVRERISGQSAAQDRITLLDRDGRRVADLVAEDDFSSVGVDWCFDITGEGDPELSIFTYSGGAHCCIRQTVYTLGPERATQLLEFEAGNAGGLAPADLDGQLPYELVGLDDRFANFEELPFVASPFIPFVMAQRGAQWVAATTEFPEVIRGHRDQVIEQFAVCEQDGTPECYRGVGLGVMAESLMLGDWDEVKRDLPLTEDARLWLELRLDAVQAKLDEPKPQP